MLYFHNLNVAATHTTTPVGPFGQLALRRQVTQDTAAAISAVNGQPPAGTGVGSFVATLAAAVMVCVALLLAMMFSPVTDVIWAVTPKLPASLT